MPSVVSTSDIRRRTEPGTPSSSRTNALPAWVAEMPSSATSVAVSKPSPNRKPSGSACASFAHQPEQRPKQAREQAAAVQQQVEVRLDERLAALDTPRRSARPRSAPATFDERRWRTGTRPRRRCRRRRRPSSAPVELRRQPSPRPRPPPTTQRPRPSGRARTRSPTPIGRCPACISLRVTLSIAAMWSASTA